MGVNLTPIIVKEILTLNDLRRRSLAVDANNYLYQFLALIRTRDGIPLKDRRGNITSHLAGLLFRSTRLIQDYEVKLVFVFDGEPPKQKKNEIAKRRELREKAVVDWQKALKEGDYATAWSKAVMTSRLTKPLIEDAKHLLSLLGIPYVQAPSEAEAQTAHMAKKGDVWAASSKDYDSLLFGATRLLRYLTIYGREYLPSKGTFRLLKPELIELQKLLAYHGISHAQLVDIALLVGTDFNKGVKGIGPKTALKLIKTHGALENLPQSIKSKLADDLKEVRNIFLKPPVTDDYALKYDALREDELYRFLCEERDFSKNRVQTVIERMKKFYREKKQADLERWFNAC
ncbi:MAG: flap endonuclease-1 [Candidatus Bathyarchaeia archaeon]|nr:flap endonuclease-1 [Candidatus Bathyarchaeota archaeon A05DMB-4]MDH7595211.1 flap endonuclease-1 [Candidatus Bathyarchaeota archaeon]